jgi:hypothetical protein
MFFYYEFGFPQLKSGFVSLQFGLSITFKFSKSEIRPIGDVKIHTLASENILEKAGEIFFVVCCDHEGIALFSVHLNHVGVLFHHSTNFWPHI